MGVRNATSLIFGQTHRSLVIEPETVPQVSIAAMRSVSRSAASSRTAAEVDTSVGHLVPGVSRALETRDAAASLASAMKTAGARSATAVSASRTSAGAASLRVSSRAALPALEVKIALANSSASQAQKDTAQSVAAPTTKIVRRGPPAALNWGSRRA